MILETEKLSVGYGDKAVVSDIRLLAEPGKLVTLIGPNGAGKSTLLKTLLRELPPLAGAVLLEGRPLVGYPPRELAQREAAVLTGRPAPELMRCEELVALGRTPYTGRFGRLGESDRALVEESMALTGVESLRGEDFTRLSDGQRQRVLLARALCQQPKLLVMDEPTSFLDLRHKLEFLTLLRRLSREKGIAVVMSLHELDLAQRFSDTLVCLREGRVDRVGTPEEIFTGGYIPRLFGLTVGSYDGVFGAAEAEKNPAPPQVFVIGGGGSGVAVYRMLQRRGIPFAAGVLPENDLDLPTARALASVLVTDRANEAVSPEKAAEALQILRGCSRVICTASFGSVNRENERLRDCAAEKNLLWPAPYD